MKMTVEHFDILESHINAYICGADGKAVLAYLNAGFSQTRVLWDLYHASRPPFSAMRDYLDTHIETAMRRILAL